MGFIGCIIKQADADLLCYHTITFYANLQEECIREDTKYKPLPEFAVKFKAKGLTKAKLVELAGKKVLKKQKRYR